MITNLLNFIFALPQILKMVLSIIERVEAARKQERVVSNLKEEIKVINAAFKDGDPSKLDELWTPNNQD